MVRPLDHVTVIQQINFAERIHQNQQTHPEISNLQAEAIEQQKRVLERRRTQATHKSERAKIHLREDRGGRRRQGKAGAKSAKGKRKGIDLTA